MTAAHRTAAAFLRSAGLVAVVLAVIAGILGMHVLTGTHATHSLASATAGAHTHHHPDASGHHASHQDSPGMPDAGAAGQDGVRATAGQSSDSCSCGGMQAMTSCTPSAKTASLAAPAPGTSVLGIHTGTATARDAVRWTYLPGSPSPCELSISRT